MKIISGIGIIVLGLVLLSHAQKENQWTFKGEGNIDRIKIIWHSNTWPDNLSGFNIKRRAINQENQWTSLNSTVIKPYNLLDKDLSNISNDKREINRLVRKRKELLLTDKFEEVRSGEFLKKANNEAFLEMQGFMYKFDYDMAPIYGFGYIDKHIPPAEFYEYGLFLVFNDNETGPVKTFRWKYGTSNIPELKLTPSYRIDYDQRKIVLSWQFNVDQFNSNETIGFNLYKKTGESPVQKINKNPIRIASVIGNLNHTEIMQENIDYYELRLVPISQFGTEGNESIITVDLNNLKADKN